MCSIRNSNSLQCFNDCTTVTRGDHDQFHACSAFFLFGILNVSAAPAWPVPVRGVGSPDEDASGGCWAGAEACLIRHWCCICMSSFMLCVALRCVALLCYCSALLSFAIIAGSAFLLFRIFNASPAPVWPVLIRGWAVLMRIPRADVGQVPKRV